MFPIDARGVQLATVFGRGISLILNVLAASGNPVPIEMALIYHIFNGKLFHSKYLQAKGGANPGQLLEVDRVSCKTEYPVIYFLFCRLQCILFILVGGTCNC